MGALEMRKIHDYLNPIICCFSYGSPALHPTLFHHLICQFNCQAERFIDLTDNGTLDELSVMGRNLGRAVS